MENKNECTSFERNYNIQIIYKTFTEYKDSNIRNRCIFYINNSSIIISSEFAIQLLPTRNRSNISHTLSTRISKSWKSRPRLQYHSTRSVISKLAVSSARSEVVFPGRVRYEISATRPSKSIDPRRPLSRAPPGIDRPGYEVINNVTRCKILSDGLAIDVSTHWLVNISFHTYVYSGCTLYV